MSLKNNNLFFRSSAFKPYSTNFSPKQSYYDFSPQQPTTFFPSYHQATRQPSNYHQQVNYPPNQFVSAPNYPLNSMDQGRKITNYHDVGHFRRNLFPAETEQVYYPIRNKDRYQNRSNYHQVNPQYHQHSNYVQNRISAAPPNGGRISERNYHNDKLVLMSV